MNGTEEAGAVRDTQSVVLALSEGAPDTRITQSVMLVMFAPAAGARITQSPVLVLAEVDADTRITQSPVLVLADVVACLTKWTQTWTITRKDGLVLAFTALDRDINYRGVLHRACDSLSATATEMASSMGSTTVHSS